MNDCRTWLQIHFRALTGRVSSQLLHHDLLPLGDVRRVVPLTAFLDFILCEHAVSTDAPPEDMAICTGPAATFE